MTWYAANTSNRQGLLVIEDDTGRNIAVTYDEKDAELVASAPSMKKSLENVLACLENLAGVYQWNKDDGDHVDEVYDIMREIRYLLG